MKTATKAFIVILLALNCLLPVSASAQFTKLLDFAGSSNGSYHYNSLITDGTFMYRMTRNGDVNNFATIFRIMPEGTWYLKLYEFDGANGKYPEHDLTI